MCGAGSTSVARSWKTRDWQHLRTDWEQRDKRSVTTESPPRLRFLIFASRMELPCFGGRSGIFPTLFWRHRGSFYIAILAELARGSPTPSAQQITSSAIMDFYGTLTLNQPSAVDWSTLRQALAMTGLFPLDN